MPRYARLFAPGKTTHIISRFAGGEWRLASQIERAEYLRRVGPALARLDWLAACFALMSSHTHWGFLAGMAPSWLFTKSLHSGFAGWLNRREKRIGPVFADRPMILCFQPEALLRLIAYIHNNPVRARVVTDPADSGWTSHRMYLGLEPPPPWLDVEKNLHLCGFDSSPAGRMAFHEYVAARAHETPSPGLSGSFLAQARINIRSAAGAPIEITSPFVHQGCSCHGIVGHPAAVWRPRWQGSVAELVDRVSLATGLSAQRIASRERKRVVVRARRIALLAGHRFLGREMKEVGEVLGLSKQAASSLLSAAPKGEELGIAKRIAEELMDDEAREAAAALAALGSGGRNPQS